MFPFYHSFIYHNNFIFAAMPQIVLFSANQQIQDKMNKLINFINDINLDSKSQKIISGEISAPLVQQKVQQFNIEPVEEKQMYLKRLGERISKISKPHKLLSVLHLIDRIYQCNPRLTYPNVVVNQMDALPKKEGIILANAINYYHYFLSCNVRNRFNFETVNPENQLAQVQNFCELVIAKITEFFKVDFIFEKGLALQQHKILFTLIVKSILVRFRDDLKIMSLFVKNNIDLVLQRTVQHPLVFKINLIYEKLIYINKNMNKLEKFSRLLKLNIEFPKYQLDPSLNRLVQQAMSERKSAQKQMKLKEQQQNYPQRQMLIYTTESFLMLDEEDCLL